MDMTYPEFLSLVGKHKMVPVYKQILADLLTPISAYLRLSQNSKYAFLFESVEKGSRFSRYSYIGRNPQTIKQQSLKIVSNMKAKIYIWMN